MAQIQLLFVTKDDIVSRLIRWFTWSDWSHVELILSDNHVIGSTWKAGVRRTYMAEALAGVTKASIYAIECDEESAHVFTAAVLRQEGKPYDLGAVFGFVFRKNWQDVNKWFCSELIAYGAMRANISLLKQIPSRVTPNDLVESIAVVLKEELIKRE